MVRIDAQATRERIHGRPARNGDEVDAFARNRQEGPAFVPGERRAVKTRHNRAVRHHVARELGQLARTGR